MPNKFKIDTFEPLKLKKADITLDKHLKAALVYQELNENYQERLSKISFWQKLLKFFKRN